MNFKVGWQYQTNTFHSHCFIYQINSQSSPPYYVALILPIIMDGDTNFWRERQIILRIYVI